VADLREEKEAVNGPSFAYMGAYRPWLEQNLTWGKTQMKEKLLVLSMKMQSLMREEGQDLIEYALVVALIAFAATAGMGVVANDINLAFTNIGTKLTLYTG
jgi:pilus assembly protein Flp/PilA